MQGDKRVEHPVIFVVGATGSGKSTLAIELAVHLKVPALGYNPHVINCDVMQMYQGLPIATNKASSEEMKGVPHHMLGFLEPTEPYTAPQFVAAASKLIHDICDSDPNAAILVCGGTHYYQQALMVENCVMENEEDPASNASGEEPSQEPCPSAQSSAPTALNGGSLWDQLNAKDPNAASLLHPNDTRRIQRRLEVLLQQQQQQDPSSSTFTALATQNRAKETLRYGTKRTMLVEVQCKDRATHNAKLDSRVDKMLTRGMLEEVTSFFKSFAPEKEHSKVNTEEGGLMSKSKRLEDTPAMADGSSCVAAPSMPWSIPTRGLPVAIGFKEYRPYVEATWPSTMHDDDGESLLKECVDSVKANTRRYARQQHQWIHNRLLPCMENALLNISKKGETSVAGDGESPVPSVPYLLVTSDVDGASPQQIIENALATASTHLLHNKDAPPQLSGVTLKQICAATQQSMKQTDTEGKDKAIRRCELCDNKVLCGAQQWESHLGSKQHKSALKRKALEERMKAEGRTLPPKKVKKGKNDN